LDLGRDDEDALLAAWCLWKHHALALCIAPNHFRVWRLARLSGMGLWENESPGVDDLFYCIDVIEVGESSFPIDGPCCHCPDA